MRPSTSFYSLSILTFALLASGCETTDRVLTAAERVTKGRTGRTIIDLAGEKIRHRSPRGASTNMRAIPNALFRDLRAAQKDFETLLAALGVNVGKTWGKKEVQLPERKNM